MSRKRNISTEMSVDKRVNRLIADGDFFAGMLYTLMIPHAEDDATITGDVGELMMTVLPGARDVPLKRAEEAVEKMVAVGLVICYTDGRLAFPVKSFYKYQSYISVGKRVSEDEQRALTLNTDERQKTPKKTEERQETAKIPASPSPSPSPSPIESPKGDSCPRIDYKSIVEDFNSICKSLPKVQRITDERRKHIRAWNPTKEEARSLFEKVEASDFCRGMNRNGWTADFDFLMSPGNRQKVIEGKYDNRQQPQQKKGVQPNGLEDWTGASGYRDPDD